MNRWYALALVAALGALFAVPAGANMNFIPNTYGLSARGMGMGNPLTATTSDLGMTFFNPAALGALRNSQVGLGYVYAAPRFESKRAGKGEPVFDRTNQLVVADLLISLRNIFPSAARGLSLGVSLTLDDNGATFIDFADRRSDRGQFLRYGRSSATIIAGLGVEVLPILMIGAGAIIQMEAEVQMQLNTDLEGRSNGESFDQVAKTVISPTVGILVPLDGLSVGLTWRAESQGQIGPIEADTLAQVGGSDLAGLPLKISFHDSFIPMQLAAGAHYYVLRNLLLAADLTWMHWSTFVEFANKEDDARDDIAFDFDDTYVPRVGIEYTAKERHSLRAGYSYEMTPVKGIGTYRPYKDLNVVGFVILDNDKHVASLGYGYTLVAPTVLKYPARFDLGLQMQYLAPREAKTSDGVKYASEGVLLGGAFTLSLGF
jgi:hypothetical protein